MHSLAIKARGRTEHRGEKENKTQRTREKEGGELKKKRERTNISEKQKGHPQLLLRWKL